MINFCDKFFELVEKVLLLLENIVYYLLELILGIGGVIEVLVEVIEEGLG